MWNVERVRVGESTEHIEDVEPVFWRGSEPDRIGTAEVSLVTLRKRAGEKLGTLALYNGFTNIEFTSNGMNMNGNVVEPAENGFISEFSRVAEFWSFTVVPD